MATTRSAVTGKPVVQLAWRRGGSKPEPFPTIFAGSARERP